MKQKNTCDPVLEGYLCHDESASRSVVSDSLRPHGLYSRLQSRILEWVAFPFSRGSPQPRSPTLQADSLPLEPQGSPRVPRRAPLKASRTTFARQDDTNLGLKTGKQILTGFQILKKGKCTYIFGEVGSRRKRFHTKEKILGFWWHVFSESFLLVLGNYFFLLLSVDSRKFLQLVGGNWNSPKNTWLKKKNL